MKLGDFNDYAQTLLVVNLIVVNFFCFLVITRHHGAGEVPGWVEMFAISLPDLPKPTRTLKSFDKHWFFDVIPYSSVWIFLL